MAPEVFSWLLRGIELSALLYGGLIGFYTLGWIRLKNNAIAQQSKAFTVCILVAARNEEQHLPALLNAFRAQQFPLNAFEVLIADDHSTDGTAALVKKSQEANPGFPIRLFLASGEGKKAALTELAAHAKADILLFTDADCSIGANWITTMISAFESADCQMVLGPVKMENDDSLSGTWQSLEFMSLIASTAGSCGVGYPAMANGANLAVRRSVFEAVQGRATGYKHASGDDVFLLFAVMRKFGRASITFLHDRNAIAETQAVQGIAAFVRQRQRWVSKSTSYQTPAVLLPALIVFVFNLALTTLLVAGFWIPFVWLLYVLFILLKALMDYPLLRMAAFFFQRTKWLRWFFLFELGYPVYVTFTAFSGLMLPVFWKGRKIK